VDTYADSLNAHYAPGDLVARLDAALRAAGLDGEGRLDPDALAPLDEFHTGGRAATEQLLALLGPAAPRRVLDLGCGVGGPARVLARRFPGAQVTGVDIVGEYCRAARWLNARAGLPDITIIEGDLAGQPAAGPPHDLVWSQHALMNVPDKAAALAAIRDRMAPGGSYAFHEACAGPGGAPHLPVPWAGEGTPSHLVDAEAFRSLLAAAGLRERAWRDTSADAVAWIDATVARRKAAPPDARELSPAPLMGPDAALKSRNLRRNLGEGRVVTVMGVVTREN
jgi:SAM-dependent methyltransferase